MLPQSVGDIRKLIADLPDEMLFDLDVRGFAAIHDAKLQVEERNAGYDGKKCCFVKRKMLVLIVDLEE